VLLKLSSELAWGMVRLKISMTASNSFFFALLILYLENAARIPLGDGTIVGDHDDGCAMLLIDAAQEPEYAFGRLFVEVACRLVGYYHFRSVDEASCGIWSACPLT